MFERHDAVAGRALGLEPAHVASLLPASTTTGLALTWPSGMPLVQPEWVAAGTAFNSMATQATLQGSVARHGMAWHGMAWHGMAWHGMVWYGMVW